MNAEDRKAFAQQIESNPLIEELLGEIERAAVERLVYAKTEQERIEGQAGVLATREFGAKLKLALRGH